MSPGRFHWRPRTHLLLWIGFWAGIFVSTHIPVPQTRPLSVDRFDKLIHFGLFFVLTWLGARYFAIAGRSSIRGLLLWAAVFVVYAALDEWLQTYVGRSMSGGDWLADTLGVLASTAWQCHGLRRLSEPDSATGSPRPRP